MRSVSLVAVCIAIGLVGCASAPTDPRERQRWEQAKECGADLAVFMMADAAYRAAIESKGVPTDSPERKALAKKYLETHPAMPHLKIAASKTSTSAMRTRLDEKASALTAEMSVLKGRSYADLGAAAYRDLVAGRMELARTSCREADFLFQISSITPEVNTLASGDKATKEPKAEVGKSIEQSQVVGPTEGQAAARSRSESLGSPAPYSAPAEPPPGPSVAARAPNRLSADGKADMRSGSSAEVQQALKDREREVGASDDKRTPLERYQGAYLGAWLVCIVTKKLADTVNKSDARGIAVEADVRKRADVGACISSGLKDMKKEYQAVSPSVRGAAGRKALEEHYVAAILAVKGTSPYIGESDSAYSKRMNENKRKTDELWTRFEITQ